MAMRRALPAKAAEDDYAVELSVYTPRVPTVAALQGQSQGVASGLEFFIGAPVVFDSELPFVFQVGFVGSYLGAKGVPFQPGQGPHGQTGGNTEAVHAEDFHSANAGAMVRFTIPVTAFAELRAQWDINALQILDSGDTERLRDEGTYHTSPFRLGAVINVSDRFYGSGRVGPQVGLLSGQVPVGTTGSAAYSQNTYSAGFNALAFLEPTVFGTLLGIEFNAALGIRTVSKPDTVADPEGLFQGVSPWGRMDFELAYDVLHWKLLALRQRLILDAGGGFELNSHPWQLLNGGLASDSSRWAPTSSPPACSGCRASRWTRCSWVASRSIRSEPAASTGRRSDGLRSGRCRASRRCARCARARGPSRAPR